MKIRGIGINGHPSWWRGDLKIFEEDLKLAQEVGFDYMEIPPHGLDVICGRKLNYKRLEKIKEIMGRYKLKYNVHAPDLLNFMDEEREELHKEVFFQVLEFSKEIGANLVVYHSGWVTSEVAKNKELFEKLKAKERESLAYFADIARDYGILLSVENSNIDLNIIQGKIFCYGINIYDLVDQIEKIDKPNVGITLDIGHGYIASKYIINYDFLSAIKRAKKFINNIHLHDNFGTVNDIKENIPYMYRIIYGWGDLHLPLGWGNIPFGKIFSIIRPNFTYITLELESRHRDEYKNSLEFAKKLCNLFL
jgi:sugar phosphate isomerase/epimerase